MSAVKKAVKKVGKFIKRYWKQIVIAAAVVFTAGLATVGTAGFASAAATAGGGMGGALSAAGSTMVAGVQAIGGVMGMGKGVNMAAFGGAGQATLGTGAAAQAMGMGMNSGVTTAAQANAAGIPSAALGGGPPSALAGGTNAATGTQAATTAGTTAADTVRSSASNLGATTQQAANATGEQGIMRTLMGGGQWMGPVMQGLSGYMQSRAMAEAAEGQDPLGYWGISPSGEDRDLTPEEIARGGLMAQTDPYYWRRVQQEQADQRNLPAPGSPGGGNV